MFINFECFLILICFETCLTQAMPALSSQVLKKPAGRKSRAADQDVVDDGASSALPPPKRLAAQPPQMVAATPVVVAASSSGSRPAQSIVQDIDESDWFVFGVQD